MSSFLASWAASLGATSYIVDLALDSNFTEFVPGFQQLNVGNVTEFNFTPLAPSTQYYWRVFAVGPGGTSGGVGGSALTVGFGGAGGGGMTTAQLVALCSNYRLYREEAIPFNPEEVYGWANFIQLELCDELNLLESVCNLALVANQERYWFRPVPITDATNTAPIVLTAPNHGMHTGDTAIASGVVGNDAANGRWDTITVIDANTLSLDGSVGNGVYTSGGMLYHGLVAATTIKNFRKTVSPFGEITWKSREDVEVDRRVMQAQSTNANLVHFYEIYDEPIRVGFQGIPGANIALEAFFYRRPIPAEDISATVDPIIPFQYQKALYLGTLYEMLDKSIRKEAQDHSKELKQQYEEEKKRIRLILTRRRMPKLEAAQGLRTK